MNSKILFITIVLILFALGLLMINYIYPLNKSIFGRSKVKAVSEKKLDPAKPDVTKEQKIKTEAVSSKSQKLTPVTSDEDKEIEKLIKELENEDLEISQKAAENLVQLGRIAILRLTAALKGANVGLKGQIIFLLGRIGDKKATSVLIEMLNDDNAYIRRNSAEALGKIKDEKALHPLAAGLFDDDIVVKERSAWALGELKDNKAVENLLNRLIDEKEERVKTAVVAALAKLSDARAIPTLLAELKSKNDQLYKNEVVMSLGEFGDRSALADLNAYLNNLKQYNPTEKMVIFQWEQAMKIAEEAIQKIQNKP